MASFLDPFLSRLRSTRATPTKAMGVPGTPIHGGFITESEKNPDLTCNKKYQTYSEILANISIVAASVRYSLNLIAKAGWTVTPADESAEAERLAELTEDIIFNMRTPWFRVVRRAAMFRFYGFSIQEWTAKRREDGVMGLEDIAPRPQATIEKWDTKTDGEVVGVIQRSPQDAAELYIPRRKLLYLVDDSLNDSPEGLGLFRHLAEPASRLERLQQLEGFNYEMDLRGVPIGRAPIAQMLQMVKNGEMTQDQFNAQIKALTDFMGKHIKNPQLGLVLDSLTYTTTDEKEAPSGQRQWDLEVINSGSAQSAEAVAVAIERLNRELARIMGTEGLLLGGDGRGSLALSKDKTDQFALITDSTLTEIRESVKKDVLDVIWMLNGWDGALKPEITTEQIQYRDVEQVTASLVDMAKAGATLMPDDPAINVVRKLLGLPEQPEMDQLDLSLLGGLAGAMRGNLPPEPTGGGAGGNAADEETNVDELGEEEA